MPQIRLVFLLLTLKNVILFSNSTEPDEFCGWKKGVMMAFHVLIVDDDPAICKLLSKVMVSNEMEPLVVNSGAAALDLIARQSSTLDMILMDIQMPVMDGYAATKAIRGIPDEAKAKVPIIAMTANAFVEDKKQAMAAGMTDYITKPLQMELLLHLLAKYAKKRKH